MKYLIYGIHSMHGLSELIPLDENQNNLNKTQLGGYETIQEAEQAIKQAVFFGHNFNNFNPNPIRKNSIKIVVTIIPSYT